MKWNHKLRNLFSKYSWFISITGLLSFVLTLIIFDSKNRGLDWSNWAESGPGAITLWGRALWDWAGLLLIPLVLAIGGFLFQMSERKADRDITKEARMDKTLDEYVNTMTSLLLRENSLLKSKKGDPIREVARTQTLSVIKRLDSERNQIVFRFLQEANLISTTKEDKSKEAEKPIISLARSDLRSVSLKKANLEEAQLTGADLTRAKLTEAQLTGADLTEANLEGAQLTGAVLTKAKLTGAHLGVPELQMVDLTEAKMKVTELQEANLTEAELSRAYLSEADLSKANLQRVILTQAYLFLANLSRANLEGAILTGADLGDADLTGANLQGAILTGADLKRAKLKNADLQGASLQGAIFADYFSNLRKENFKGTKMPDGTKFSESTDLKKFTGQTKEE